MPRPGCSIAFEKALTLSCYKLENSHSQILKEWRVCCTLSRLASCMQGLLIEVYFAVCLVMLSALLWNHYSRLHWKWLLICKEVSFIKHCLGKKVKLRTLPLLYIYIFYWILETPLWKSHWLIFPSFIFRLPKFHSNKGREPTWPNGSLQIINI